MFPAMDDRRPSGLNSPRSHSFLTEAARLVQQGQSKLQQNVVLTPPPQTTFIDPWKRPAPYDGSREFLNQSVHLSGANMNTGRQLPEYDTGKSTEFPSFDAIGMMNGLQIRTDFENNHRSNSTASIESEVRLRSSASAASLPLKIPNARARLHSSAGSLSPGSAISSPQIAAMMDITPLPSPTMGSLETWKMLAKSRSRNSSVSSKVEAPVTSAPSLSPPRRKGYAGLTHVGGRPVIDHGEADGHSRTRSLSEYVPEAAAQPKLRNITVSGTGPSAMAASAQAGMHREEYLGVQRGIVVPGPSARPSNAGLGLVKSHEDEPKPKRPRTNEYVANSVASGQLRRYEGLRVLGKGTFSKVYLAVRQTHDAKDSLDYGQESTSMAGVRARSRRLVAVKIVEPGPAGGADAERIETSLRREVELMKMIHHPSIVHLKAFGAEGNGRACLVMNYCPGGDLFDLASRHLHVLTPPLVRRIFSELVSAVRYLHQKYIVHRDIKLENVLLNIPVQVHEDVPDWQTLDRAVVTLTDLGLSRDIPRPPESPMLQTRCGSEDYAAPEILMGQMYDGRQTDAWALGVLLYALMEGRLPFDPLPNARGDPATLRARTPHRIARCEWAWVKYGDDDGDWDSAKGKDLDGAMKCVDALLKRNTRRKPLSEIRDWPWVRDGIQIDGGLRWVEEEGT